MRRFLAISVLISAALPSLGQSGIQNGDWWLALNAPMKTLWVNGFVLGAHQATSVMREITTPKTLPPNQAQGCSNTKAGDFTNIQFDQFTTGLDLFYKDHRNTRIHVDDAMLLVRDSISGCPTNVWEVETNIFRQQAATPDYDK